MGSALIPLGIGVASGLGSFLGANQQQKANKAQTEEQKREFNIAGLPGAARGAETAGLRDKLLAIFGQMAQGGGPQQFQPRDAFNPTSIGPGGPMGPQHGTTGGGMQGQMGLPQNYQMGMGGVNPDVYQFLLQQLGYKPPTDPSRMPQPQRPPAGPSGPGTGGMPFSPRNPLGGGLMNPSGQRSY